MRQHLSLGRMSSASATATTGTNEKVVASEDELGQKWDRCIADTVLKTGILFNAHHWDFMF